MKYLKEYSGFNKPLTQSDIDDIMDVLQDIIDEYDIELYEDHQDQGISYNFIGYMNKSVVYDKSIGNDSLDTDYSILLSLQPVKANKLEIRIFSPIKDGKIIPFPSEKDTDLTKDIFNFIERLKLMDYTIKTSTREAYNNLLGSNFIEAIIIEISGDSFETVSQKKELPPGCKPIKRVRML